MYYVYGVSGQSLLLETTDSMIFSLCVPYIDSEHLEGTQHSSGNRSSVCEEDITEQWCPSCECMYMYMYAVYCLVHVEIICTCTYMYKFMHTFSSSIHASVSGTKAQLCCFYE